MVTHIIKHPVLFNRKPIVYVLSLICDEMSFIRGIKYDRIFIFVTYAKCGGKC